MQYVVEDFSEIMLNIKIKPLNHKVSKKLAGKVDRELADGLALPITMRELTGCIHGHSHIQY